MSVALSSMGMLLKHGDGGGTEVFTTVPGIKSIQGPGGSAAEIDVTDLSSTAKEFRLGIHDEGSLTVSFFFAPANATQAACRTDHIAKTLRNWKLLFTDAGPTTWSFSAYVTAFSIDNGIDNVTMATMTLRISGSIVAT